MLDGDEAIVARFGFSAADEQNTRASYFIGRMELRPGLEGRVTPLMQVEHVFW